MIRTLDRRGRVTAVPFQRREVRERLGLSLEQCMREAWIVEPTGRRYQGAGAVLAALAWAMGATRLAAVYHTPGLRQVADVLYALVAKYRGELPGAKPYCRCHPEECR